MSQGLKISKSQGLNLTMKKKYIYLWCLLLLLGSCTERIDIDVDNAVPQVVITGRITTDTTVHTVTVAQTIRYFGIEAPKTFSSATVTINDALLQSLGNGVYGTDPGFYGEPGKKYQLKVELDVNDDGHTSYYTAEAVMPPMHRLDSIYLRPLIPDMDTINNPHWVIIANFMDVKDVPNLFGGGLWINEVNFSNYLRRYFLNFNDEMAGDGQYIRFPLVPEFILRKDMNRNDEEDFPLYTGDTITVELSMLDKPYFDYLRAAKTEISGSNPVFAGPPANVPSNIQGGALGIFGAYTVSRQSLVLKREHGFPDRPE